VFDTLILLVEDNLDDEALILRALKQIRSIDQVAVARDGQEALDFLYGRGKYADRDLRWMPSLILLDLHLPKLDGLEVLKRLRADERTRHTPVVILTGSADQEEMLEGSSAGANSCVRKPGDPNEFREAVMQVARYWRVLDRTRPK
jgi:two-component system response regulator